MPDQQNNVAIYTYRYNIKNIMLTTDQNYAIRDGSVVYLYILHDYIKRRLPWIKIHLELDTSVIANIYKNQDKAKLKIDLYEYQYSNEQTIVNTSLYLQHTFSLIPARDKNNYITSEDSTTTEVLDPMKNLQLFEAYLVDMDAVNWMNKEICTMFKECSKPAALQALVQMRSVPSGILIMTPPLDNNKIDYVIIPLGDMIGNIQFLNKRYGLYNCDPIIYYDLDYLYCISRVEPDITMPLATDYGNIVMILANPTSPSREIVGSCTDIKSKTHYINLRQSPQVNDYTNKITSTKFATIATVNAKGDVSKASLSETDTALEYVYEENDMTKDQYINDKLTGPSVTVVVNNSAVSFLRPYKNVTFSVGSQLLSLGIHDKSYRLYAWALSITRDGSGGENAEYTHELQIQLGQPTALESTTNSQQ